MKGKQLALLLAVAVFLGGAWITSYRSKQASWQDSGRSSGKVVEFPLNDVNRIHIKTAASELNLVKKDNVWSVQERADYPANFEQVGSMLRKLWDLKPVQAVKVGPSQLSRLDLVEPGQGENSGTSVKFLAADGKELASLLLGKKHMRKSEGAMDFGGSSDGFPAGRYLKSSSSSQVSLVSETLDEIDPNITRFLATDFINVDGPKAVSVSGEQTWSLARESASADWQLSGAKPDEKLDTGKVSPLNSVLSSSTITDVRDPALKVEAVLTAVIETFEGFKYELKIGKEEGDNCPVSVVVSGNFAKERIAGADEKPEDKTRLDGEFTAKLAKLEEKLAKEKKLESRTYFLSKFRLEPLMKERKALLADKPAEEPKPEQPKPEQPKPEQPKPEQPKPEQPKPEQPKPEQPKPEQPKPEQPKPEQPK